MRFKNRRFRVAAALVAGVAVLAFVSGAWAVISGGTAPTTFVIHLDGELIATAKGYELNGANVTVDRKDSYKEYTLRINLALKDNSEPARAFQTGQTFTSAKVDLVTASIALLKTYELVNATVVAYRQSGDAATGTFNQELVLTSRTLTISGP